MAGRPKLPRTKRALGVRLTDEARSLLEQLATRRGVSQTAIIEQLIRDEAEKRGIVPTRKTESD